MSKIFLHKEYTRDYSLMIEEMWNQALSHSVDGIGNPHQPKNIYYISDGMMEVWENKEAIDWYREQLLLKNNEQPDFFHTKMDEYEEFLKNLKKLWKNKHADVLEDLQKFVNLATKGMKYFLIFYYTAMDSRNQKDIFKRANQIRDKDIFFDQVDNFIKNSVAKIYPDRGKFANSVFAAELDDMPTAAELEKRYQNFVIDFPDYAKIEKLKDFADKHKDYNFAFDKVEEDLSELKGQAVFKGKASGRAKILKRKDQIIDFQQGEILVSPMTTPDFVPAMKKAAAIITDEGGVVCHAAILARELKIPCVIATKVATKVFKDGDMLEVDAEKGIVKKK